MKGMVLAIQVQTLLGNEMQRFWGFCYSALPTPNSNKEEMVVNPNSNDVTDGTKSEGAIYVVTKSEPTHHILAES